MRETWWVAEGAQPALDAAGLVSVAACMAVAAGGTRLSSDRQSAAVRLEGDPALFLKWRRPRLGRRWKTWLRASRERREARVALRLHDLGIDAPAPLAVAERRHAGRLVGAALVRPFLEGVVTADRWLATGAQDERLLHATRALARWHDAGFRHGDCYPKNVLVDLETEHALPIGAPYGHFTAAGTQLDRARLRDVAQWAAGLGPLGFAVPQAVVTPYARAAGLGLGMEDLVRPLLERILARKAARQASQAQREPGGAPLPTPLRPDAGPIPRLLLPLGRLR